MSNCRLAHRRWLFPWVLAFLGAVFLLTGPHAPSSNIGRVSANGATRLIVNNAEAGPYLLRVGILPGSPKVGTLHVSILVQDASGAVTVSGATVMMSVEGPEGGTAGAPVKAQNQPQSPQLYEGNVELNMPGSWTLNLATDSPLGKGDLAVPLEVTDTTGFNSLFIIVGVVVVLIVGSLLWSQAQRARRRSQ